MNGQTVLAISVLVIWMLSLILLVGYEKKGLSSEDVSQTKSVFICKHPNTNGLHWLDDYTVDGDMIINHKTGAMFPVMRCVEDRSK